MTSGRDLVHTADTAYVPESLEQPEVCAYPYPAYEHLRASSPFRFRYVTSRLNDQATNGIYSWALLKHRDVHDVLLDDKTFISSSNPLVAQGIIPRLTLLHDDKPRHARLKTIVNHTFTKKHSDDMGPWIRATVDELLAANSDSARDLMSTLAVPLPMRVIARLLGMPERDYLEFRSWSEALLAVTKMPVDQRAKRFAAMREYFVKLAATRRTRPQNDLVSDLVHAQVEGASLDEDEVVGFCMLLLIAGNETTTNLIGNLLGILAARPDLWELLRQDRTCIDSAIEEALRLESPIQRLLRTAVTDVTISGVQVAAGDCLTVFYGAANRDPLAFKNPNEFIIDRDRRRSVAFGAGIHWCLGAQLALIECRAALSALLDRYSAVTPGVPPARRQTSHSMGLGYEFLPLRLEA